MPNLVQAAVAAYKAGIVAAVFTSANAGMLLAAAAEAYTIYATAENARNARNDARAAQQSNAQDRLITVRSSIGPKQIIVGKTRVAGYIPYACTHGENNKFMTLCVVFAGHECQSIDEVWFDDESIGPLDGNGYVQSSSKYYKHDIRFDSIVQQSGVTQGNSITISDAISISSVAETMPSGEGTQRIWSVENGLISINNKTITFNETTTNPVAITYVRDFGRPLVRVKKYLGIAAGERDTDLEAASPVVYAEDGVTPIGREFTSTMVGKHICRIHVTIEYDKEIFFGGGAPNITAVIKGAKFRNWSAGTVAWTENVAQIAAGYLMHPLGPGFAQASFNQDMMEAAESACAEDVPTGVDTVQARYTCGGVLKCDASWSSNLKQIIEAMAGSVTLSGGQWVIRAGVYQGPPTYTLTDDDFADKQAISIVQAPERGDLFNSIGGTFTSAPTARDTNRKYATTDFASYSSTAYVTEDRGVELWQDISLPLVQDDLQAERIARLLLHRHRNGFALTASFKMSAWPLMAGDPVYIKSDFFGWSDLNEGLGKEFVVLERRFNSDGTVELTLKEDTEAIHEWDYQEQIGVDATPNTSLPDPRYVVELTGVEILSDETTFSRLSDGTIIPRVEVSWAEITDQGVVNGGKVICVWKPAEESTWRRVEAGAGTDVDETRRLYLTPVSAGQTIQIMLYAENGAGVRSAPVLATYKVSDDLQTGKAVISANRLKNSTFANSGGWTPFDVSVPAGSTKVEVPTSDAGYVNALVLGEPRNLMLRVNSALSGAYEASCYTDPIAVSPGERIVAFLSMLPQHCDAVAALMFYDAQGNWLTQYNTPSVAGVSAAQFFKSENHTQVSVFGEAPIGARYCRLVPHVNNFSSAATPKLCSILKPFVGAVEPAVNTLPEWAAGGSNSLDPILLPDGAAVQFRNIDIASGMSMIVPLAYSAERKLDEFTAEVPGKVFITITAEFETTYAGALFAQVYDPNLKPIGAGINVLPYDAANTSRARTVTFSGIIPVARDQTVTPTLYIQQNSSPNPTDTGGTHVNRIIGKIEVFKGV